MYLMVLAQMNRVRVKESDLKILCKGFVEGGERFNLILFIQIALTVPYKFIFDLDLTAAKKKMKELS